MDGKPRGIELVGVENVAEALRISLGDHRNGKEKKGAREVDLLDIVQFVALGHPCGQGLKTS